MARYFILDNFNTYYDFGLILTEKKITPSEPKTKYVELDGVDGSIDLTEALTGEIPFSDRTISMSFWTDNGTRAEREALFHDITTKLHGRKINIIEPDDPEHYYVGRIKVTPGENRIPFGEISITAECEPWRYNIEDTVRTIDFPDAYVPKQVVFINNGRKTVCPTITTEFDTVITFNGVTRHANIGTSKFSDIKFRHGTNIVTVEGYGNVTFTYKEADI